MNDLVATMKRLDIPFTRENYIDLAYGNDVPNPWTPEHEEELPEELQDWQRFEMRGETMVLKPGASATSEPEKPAS